MKKFLISIFGFIYLNALNCSSVNSVKKYGGHYYTITSKKMTFLEAKQFAKANDGYLAIPNNSDENNFLKSLIPTPKYAWIGIYDPDYMTNYCYENNECVYDDSRFVDIKGNALTYTNWAEHQPDNLVKVYDIVNGKEIVTPLGEHWVAISSLDGKWADFGNHGDEYNNPIKYYALIEFDSMPDCYTPPSDVIDTYSGAKCNTQVWDKKTGITSKGKTYKCLQDKYNHYYCPALLAPAGEEWDYEDGYSKKVSTSFSFSPDCKGFIYNGKCYENVSEVKIEKTLGCVSRRIPCTPSASSCCHIDISCNGKEKATIKYYDCCPSAGSLKKIVYINDMTKFYSGVKYQKYGNAKIICNKEGSCSIYFQNYYCNGGLIGSTYRTGTFNLTNNNKYICKDGEYVSDRLQKADPKRCYNPVSLNQYKYCKGGSFNNQSQKCDVDYSYYDYLCSNEKNEFGETFIAQNKGGDCHPNSVDDLIDGKECNSPNPPKNNCKREKFICKPAPNRKPVLVDNKWQCSPFPCFGEGAGDYNVTNADTPVGINDKKNDGWNNDGSCSGKIYIFNGKDNRCRNNDMFFGLTGGGCCDKDKVFMGLVSCKEDEKLLAKKRDKKQCHYIGEYCSKELNLIFTKICIQHKQTYCCFNSLLARLINEQGRPQIRKGWGSAESPDCSGFTPEQFQKLDFSKLDLSEFYDQITQNVTQSFADNMNTYIQNSVTNQLENMTNQ